MSEDYEVGYKRPPKSTQFKPGQSGNPKGRSKRAQGGLDRAEIFRRVAHEVIGVQTDTGLLKITRCKALVHRIATMALSGDEGAWRLLHRLRKIFPNAEPEFGPPIFYISEDDAKL